MHSPQIPFDCREKVEQFFEKEGQAGRDALFRNFRLQAGMIQSSNAAFVRKTFEHCFTPCYLKRMVYGSIK